MTATPYKTSNCPPEHSSHKASFEDRLFALIETVDALQACALLRIETDEPEGAMQNMNRDGAIITLVRNGTTVVPLLQFDTANGRIFDVVRDIQKLRPASFSNLRLVNWLTRSHADFGCAPAKLFGYDDAAILSAFRRDIEPDLHG